LDGFPDRPKGMRWRTYYRLENEYEHYRATGLAPIVRGLFG
jgi:hypothetical protein